MKKLTLFLCSLALVFSLAGVAGATSYDFEDMIDDWGKLDTDAVRIGQYSPLVYTHNITDNVNFSEGDVVTSAILELDFTNDVTDDYGSNHTFFGTFRYDYREFAIAKFEGSHTVYIGEVDNGQYIKPIDIAWLNDGRLEVRLGVSNDRNTASAWLDHSRLYGTAAKMSNGNGTAPVPEPSTILLMGAGLLGLVAVGRRKFNRKE